MSRSIAINGVRLDQVRMPLGVEATGTVSFLSYPKNRIQFTQDDQGLRLVIPAFLAVELYRLGVLPQDVDVPVAISIGSRLAGQYVVRDVCYPERVNSPFEEVAFTLTRVQRNARETPKAAPRPRAARASSGTYVTDITHFLDEAGEIAEMPHPARKMASFLTLLIEAATTAASSDPHNSGIRCRTKACQGIIQTLLPTGGDEIAWHCPVCGHNGVIRNWQNTKWNQLERTDEPA